MPLRPELYRRLHQRIGKIIIAHQGESLQAKYDESAEHKFTVTNYGESFRVSCPYCGDTRNRLWISHAWALYDNGRLTNLHLCKCFNEDCLSSYERRMDLFHRVFDDVKVGRSLAQNSQDVIYTGEYLDDSTWEFHWPGEITYLSDLPTNHPAHLYLQDRGFDSLELAYQYNLSYCTQATDRYRKAQDRLIIPIYQEQQLVGWQARLLQDPVPKYTAKYVTMTGMKKTRVLYNLDEAIKQPYGILVEGCSDVWNVSQTAVALLGKKISTYQLKMIYALYGKGVWKQVFILLDGDAQDEALELYDALSGIPNKVKLDFLETGEDPGSYPRDALLSEIDKHR